MTKMITTTLHIWLHCLAILRRLSRSMPNWLGAALLWWEWHAVCLVLTVQHANPLFLGQWKGEPEIPNASLEDAEKRLEDCGKEEFLPFVKRMLRWKPKERSSARELLDDPWLKLWLLRAVGVPGHVNCVVFHCGNECRERKSSHRNCGLSSSRPVDAKSLLSILRQYFTFERNLLDFCMTAKVNLGCHWCDEKWNQTSIAWTLYL